MEKKTECEGDLMRNKRPQITDKNHGRSPLGVRCEVERSTAFNFVHRKASPEETSDRLDFSSVWSSVGGMGKPAPTQVQSGNSRPELESTTQSTQVQPRSSGGGSELESPHTSLSLHFFSSSSKFSLTTRNSQPKTQNSFTLVEMMVVVLIISVLAAILVPTVQNIRKDSMIDNTKAVISQVEIMLEKKEEGDWLDNIRSGYSTSDLDYPERYYVYTDEAPNFGGNPNNEGYLGTEESELRLEQIDERNGYYVVVDTWGNPLYICQKGFNNPGLDIWSKGPDEKNNSDSGHDISGGSDPYEYNPTAAGDDDPKDHGDDIVNWTREGNW
ncbi:hypothetical protein AKJ51_04480 [candidate division MSBL1 archaeon SCGC-AAA382A20]|uniref:Type II secretion system protein GspG C-terminal domain-containing protein n=1 Tax=candidate division MSBL1 archaeon SCGC-AAA382A20 TaxID=1698280 RepID=A0A133VHK2_9EURY|nr:hypothetical protein AKJ51_04480 [candidate division MSBL1 archaeon SCGC-AAA382A20]